MRSTAQSQTLELAIAIAIDMSSKNQISKPDSKHNNSEKTNRRIQNVPETAPLRSRLGRSCRTSRRENRSVFSSSSSKLMTVN